MPEARVAVVQPGTTVLDEVQGDLLVLGVHEDERPLRGLVGLADWRLCGFLSRIFQRGLATGRFGERVLCPSQGRLEHRSLLLFGLGPEAEHRTDRVLRAAEEAFGVCAGLGARTVTCGLFGLERLTSPAELTAAALRRLVDAQGWLEALTIVTDRTDLEVLVAPRWTG